MAFDRKVLNFYKTLSYPQLQSKEVMIINPHEASEVKQCVKEFYAKFYSDDKKRVFVLGINPGRFGSGVTGVPFTDPIALEDICRITNHLPKRKETSSDFVYKFIESWGGAEKFYSSFFLSAVSPVGFTKNGLNYNYYDDEDFLDEVKPFIIETLKAQIGFGARKDTVILFGTGKNQKVFKEINDEHGFFNKILAVEHPRFIMQYKRKHLAAYLDKYKRVFEEALA